MEDLVRCPVQRFFDVEWEEGIAIPILQLTVLGSPAEANQSHHRNGHCAEQKKESNWAHGITSSFKTGGPLGGLQTLEKLGPTIRTAGTPFSNHHFHGALNGQTG